MHGAREQHRERIKERTMPYEEVGEPIPWQQAFEQSGSAALQSQAAFLLLLGRQMGRGPKTGLKAVQDSIPEGDRAQFPLPPILHPARRRVAVEDIQASLARRYPWFIAIAQQPQLRAVTRPDLDDIVLVGPMFRAISGEEKQEILSTMLPDLVRRFDEKPTRLAAAELMEVCLFHSDSLVRIAAAASYLRIRSEWGGLLSILEQGTRDKDSLVRDVAATALTRVARSHPRLAELARGIPVRMDGEPSQTSLLVHGTFARNFSWWHPGSNFHSYLLKNVRKDLYGAQDVFSWSGLYNHTARDRGARDLGTWVKTRGMNGLDHLFAHSHGGSVAMLATQHGIDIEKLILLSCPVHNYMPDFKRVKKIISIRVHLDLVVLADGGRQKYRHPQIQEHVLPVWFNHSATRDPYIWQKYKIPNKL